MTPITSAAEILGDILPEGTYGLSVYVGTVRGELELDVGEMHLQAGRETQPASSDTHP
ncbi:MAG TPA: hypothetical protein VG799_05290 [Gemmatimonadota bacterium]|nr:hypothetical protein [Gemmatimonadota bacterium]